MNEAATVERKGWFRQDISLLDRVSQKCSRYMKNKKVIFDSRPPLKTQGSLFLLRKHDTPFVELEILKYFSGALDHAERWIISHITRHVDCF